MQQQMGFRFLESIFYYHHCMCMTRIQHFHSIYLRIPERIVYYQSFQYRYQPDRIPAEGMESYTQQLSAQSPMSYSAI
jgi:hypothetical protein